MVSVYCRSTSPDVAATSIAEVQGGGVSTTTSDDRYLGHYHTVTPSSSTSSQSSLEASVWQQYRYYQNQFYRTTQSGLPQYQYAAEPPTYHSPSSWLHPSHPHQYQHQQSQLHLPDGVGIAPAPYHHFREMNGLCCYDSVY